MIDRIKLLDVLLDNQDIDDDSLIIKIERFISEGIGFNHSEKDIKTACKISELRGEVSFSSEYDKISKEVEELEKTFTKREIAATTITLIHKINEINNMMQLLKILRDRSKGD
jgi:hypothetical protein